MLEPLQPSAYGMSTTWRLCFTVPQAAADRLADGLTVLEDLVFDRSAVPNDSLDLAHADPNAPIACLLYAQDEVRLRKNQALVKIIAELACFDLPEMAIERVPEADWVRLAQENLPPVIVKPFYIRGSHSPPAPEGLHDLLVDAGLAFGTGHHETTRGCLQLYAQLLVERQPARVLDMGCGSGILAMAAARTSKAEIIGVECHVDSVQVAKENALLNGVADRLTLLEGDRPDLAGGGYDLIFANILARPLIDLAAGFGQIAAPRANLLLAGLLVGQEADVLSAYAVAGWTQVGGFHDGQWAILRMQKL